MVLRLAGVEGAWVVGDGDLRGGGKGLEMGSGDGGVVVEDGELNGVGHLGRCMLGECFGWLVRRWGGGIDLGVRCDVGGGCESLSCCLHQSHVRSTTETVIHVYSLIEGEVGPWYWETEDGWALSATPPRVPAERDDAIIISRCRFWGISMTSQ